MSRSEIFTGKYLFHFHTNYTDGNATVIQYFEHAEKLGFDRLIFLEHIRREPSYDVQQFVSEVDRCRRQFGIAANIGFEAKLVGNGQLDVRDEHVELADVIGIAEHGRPQGETLPDRVMSHFLTEELDRFHQRLVVWAHPGLWFRKCGMGLEWNSPYWSTIELAIEKGVRIEHNLRYNTLPLNLSDRITNHVVIGFDAHGVEELVACHLRTGARNTPIRRLNHDLELVGK